MSREIPIIFNSDMVRAILSGQKTQTRRPVKVQPHGVGSWVKHGDKWAFPNVNPYCSARCPFGQPGDLLWVRETWSQIDDTEFGGERWIDYRATPRYPESSVRRPAGWDDEAENTPLRWRPSIHMPRWASRILLRVTAVRIERVQDISEQDAWAEGCPKGDLWVPNATGGLMPPKGKCLTNSFPTSPHWFSCVWNGIYGNWAANPWVWVIEFERVTDSKREAA